MPTSDLALKFESLVMKMILRVEFLLLNKLLKFESLVLSWMHKTATPFLGLTILVPTSTWVLKFKSLVMNLVLKVGYTSSYRSDGSAKTAPTAIPCRFNTISAHLIVLASPKLLRKRSVATHNNKNNNERSKFV